MPHCCEQAEERRHGETRNCDEAQAWIFAYGSAGQLLEVRRKQLTNDAGNDYRKCNQDDAGGSIDHADGAVGAAIEAHAVLLGTGA